MARPKPFSNESEGGIARELAAAQAKIERLFNALALVREAIEETAPDTVWMDGEPPETACDYITRVLEAEAT